MNRVNNPLVEEIEILIAEQKYYEEAILLVTVHKDIDGEGGTIIDYSIWWNNYELLFFLINEFNIDILKKDKDGDTLLNIAIVSGIDAFKIIELLINLGINPNEKNEDGDNSLHIAVGMIAIDCPNNDNIKIIELLLKKNIKINEKNNEGNTPLDLAIEAITERCNKNMKMVELLLKAGAFYNIEVGI